MNNRATPTAVLAAALLGSMLATPASAVADPRALAVSGQVIRDAGGAGQVVDLRGTNLGGWLLQEGWMSPAGQAALDRGNWTATTTSTEPGGSTARALDGDPATRWSSGQAHAPGHSFVVDMKEPTAFDQVGFEVGASAGDYPESYQIWTSDDAVSWDLLKEVSGSGPQALTATRSTTARYLSINLTQPKSTQWWSISELNVYISDEYNTRRVLTERFGTTVADELIRSYQDAWITEADLDVIAGLGLNTVRVPIDYQVLMRPDGTMRPDAEAFAKLDWLVAQSTERGLYVVFDLHGTPGAACPWHSCGRAGTNQLWQNPTYQDWTVQIWERLADRYAGNSTVAAYDLLNEPLVSMGTLESPEQVRQKFDFYDRLYDAVRAVDDSTIIMVAAFYTFEQALPPSEYGWTNVVYQTHHYNFGAQDAYGAMSAYVDRELAALAHYRALWEVPIFAGEFWLSGFDDLTERWLGGLNDMHVSWTNWTYKVRGAADSVAEDGVRLGDDWSLFYDNPSPVPDLNIDSAATIRSKWQAFSTANFRANATMQAIYRAAAAQPVRPSTPAVIEAEAYSAASGLQVEATDDYRGVLNLGWVDAGDSATYDLAIPAAGTYSLTFRVASPGGAPGAFTVVLADGGSVQVDVPATGGWQNWTDVQVRAHLPEGDQRVVLQADAPGWNLNWFTIREA